MKKIIAVLLTIISMFSFFILFNNENLNQISNMEKVEQTQDNTYSLLLPSMGDITQIDMYNIIIEVLNKHNADIYFTRVGDNNKTIKYIYISELSYFNNFIIKNGRSFNLDENESSKYLSTEITGDSEQIGNLASFAGKGNFEIRTLKSMIDDSDFFITGYCDVKLTNNDEIDLFIQDLEAKLGVEGITRQKLNSHIPEYYHNKFIIPALYFIIGLLILYSVLKSYKKFGVQMLLGHSKIDIWLKETYNLLFTQCAILIATNIFMTLCLFKEYNLYFIDFLKLLLLQNLKSIVIILIISSLPYLYIHNIKITEMLKNKLPITEIIIFNSFIKILTIVLVFNLINQGIENYDRIKSVFNNNYKQWEDAEGYYILPFINVKNGDVDYSEFKKMQEPLYYNINKEGAIFAKFNSYSELSLKMDNNLANYEIFAIANPNYLEKNIVYDLENNPVFISEEESNYILLVPDKFKEAESDIVARHTLIKNGYGENSSMQKQDIKIIYTKSNQKLFSYSVEINPTEGNFVTDPIIRVITEKNGDAFEFGQIIGENGSPIKIKVDSAANPEEFIYSKLKYFGLEKNVDKISKANEGIAFETKEVYDLLIFILGGLVVLLVGMILIIIQNIYCFFEQYKKNLAIRQLQGYKNIHKYKELVIIFFITWIGAFVVSNCLIEASIRLQAFVIIIFMFIELLITIITITIVSREKIISVIKGR